MISAAVDGILIVPCIEPNTRQDRLLERGIEVFVDARLDGARHVADDPCGIPRLAHHADLHIDDEQDGLVAFANSCHRGFH